MARAEAEEARREAAEARASAAAAHGASAGALRDARDAAAKLRLRETHWVGLVECHREAASASRAIAERVAKGAENDSDAVGEGSALAARAELEAIARRRVELEAEASRHAEAIDAVAAMLPEEVRGVENAVSEAGASGNDANLSRELSGREPTGELARLEARASAAESAAEALRVRLARKTEDAAALALRAKRHELRAEEAALSVAASARERREAAEAFRAKQAETEETARRLRHEASAAMRKASSLKAALEDRDAALDVGVAVVRADPELARAMMRRRDARSSAGSGDDDGSGDDASSRDEEDIARTESGNVSSRWPAPNDERSRGVFAPNLAAGVVSDPRRASPSSPRAASDASRRRSPRRFAKKKKKMNDVVALGVVPLTSPEAVAAAVAEATRAIATTPGSVESRARGRASLSRGAPRSEAGRLEPFADLDDVVAPPARVSRFANSPGGESVGSVGHFDAASARAVDAAVDALARGAAEAGVRGVEETSTKSRATTNDEDKEEKEANERAPSPFRGFLDAFSPRRRGGSSPRAAAPSVEEETEDSEATEPGVPSADEGDENAAASADANARGASSRSPLPGVSGSSFGTSLPGGSSFVRDAEAHLAIEVKKAWFGLRDDASPSASPSSRLADSNAEGPARRGGRVSPRA